MKQLGVTKVGVSDGGLIRVLKVDDSLTRQLRLKELRWGKVWGEGCCTMFVGYTYGGVEGQVDPLMEGYMPPPLPTMLHFMESTCLPSNRDNTFHLFMNISEAYLKYVGTDSISITRVDCHRDYIPPRLSIYMHLPLESFSPLKLPRQFIRCN